MRIKVLINFGGVLTNERRILPGIYEAEDPRLFGIADYLVEHKFAHVVQEHVPLTEFPEDTRPIEDVKFHNELMRKKGRPELPNPQTEDVVTFTVDDLPDVTADEIERDALVAEYERLFDKAPHHNAKNETIRNAIEEHLAEHDTPDAND